VTSCTAPRVRRLSSCTLAVSLFAAGAARANNAFPDEFSVHLPRNSPKRIAVGANFGFLVSDDAGSTWRYACEPWVTQGSSASLSAFSVNFYDVLADGSVLAASNELTRADVNDAPGFACTWPASSGSVKNQVISDIFADPGVPTVAFASIDITSSGGGGSKIIVSHDGGKNFDATPIYDGTNGGNCGSSGKPPCFLVTGIESSTSSPGVVYATTLELSGATSQLLKFSNYGGSPPTGIPDSAEQIKGAAAGSQPRILIVDPTDANKVYLRVLDGSTDNIYVTSNGTGSSATRILQLNGLMTGFLLANDGAIYVGTMDGSLYTRPAGATAFTSRNNAPHFRCLGQRRSPNAESRIYACGDMNLDNFSLGYSDDNGATFKPMMKFGDLQGPLACAQVQTACAAHWDRIQGVLCIGPYVASCAGDAGTGPPPPPGKSSSCASVAAGTSALLLVVAFWLKRRGRKAGTT
jgi:hypothetical protein